MMKTKLSEWSLALAFMLTAAGTVLADPMMSSVSIGSMPAASRGGSTSCLVTVTRTGNGNMEIYLSAAGFPPGVSVTFTPNPILFTGANVSGTATMQISIASGILPGAYPFSVIARDGGSHNSMTNSGTLNVNLPPPGIA